MWRGFRSPWKMYIVKNHAWISKMFLKMFIFPWTFEVASQSYRSTTGNKKAENWLFFSCPIHTPPQGVCSAFHKITGTIISFICIKGTGQTGLWLVLSLVLNWSAYFSFLPKPQSVFLIPTLRQLRLCTWFVEPCSYCSPKLIVLIPTSCL